MPIPSETLCDVKSAEFGSSNDASLAIYKNENTIQAAQLLNAATELKDDVIKGDEVDWKLRHQLQKLYERIILLDLDFSLSKHIEHALWNFCYKNVIDVYQRKLKVKRSEGDSGVLSMFLTAAVGYFSELLTKLSVTYRVDFPGQRSLEDVGIICNYWAVGGNAKKDNVLYFAQFCFIHLGDVARYQKQMVQAESYYMHAIQVLPNNGHPFNQLAILETARGNRLSSAYLYVRSLFVDVPFQLAATNLDKFYSSTRPLSPYKKSEAFHAITTAANYVNQFLIFHALIHHGEFLTSHGLQNLSEELAVELVACLETGSVNAYQIQHMLVINMGALWKICDKDEGQSKQKLDFLCDLSSTERLQYDYCAKLMLQQLACLLKFCSCSSELSKRLPYLPVIKVGTDWLRQNIELVNNIQICGVHIVSELLSSLAEFLNAMQFIDVKKAKPSKDYVPLPEDEEMRGFLPMSGSLKSLDFSFCCPTDNDQLNWARIGRLLLFGKWLTEVCTEKKHFSGEQKEGSLRIVFSSHVLSRQQSEQNTLITHSDASEATGGTRANNSNTTIGTNSRADVSKPPQDVSPDSFGDGKQGSRSSKLVAMKTILARNRSDVLLSSNLPQSPVPDNTVSRSGDTSPSDTPRLRRQGLAGSIKADASNENRVQRDSQSKEGSGGKGASNSNSSSRYQQQLPPRFQAAKLKLALGGGGSSTTSVSAAFGPKTQKADSLTTNNNINNNQNSTAVNPNKFPVPPNSAFAMSGSLSLAGFPPLNPLSCLSNADDGQQVQAANICMRTSESQSLDGEDITTPIGSCDPNIAPAFPKTPGVRPAAPHFPVSQHPQTQSFNYPPPPSLFPVSSSATGSMVSHHAFPRPPFCSIGQVGNFGNAPAAEDARASQLAGASATFAHRAQENFFPMAWQQQPQQTSGPVTAQANTANIGRQQDTRTVTSSQREAASSRPLSRESEELGLGSLPTFKPSYSTLPPSQQLTSLLNGLQHSMGQNSEPPRYPPQQHAFPCPPPPPPFPFAVLPNSMPHPPYPPLPPPQQMRGPMPPQPMRGPFHPFAKAASSSPSGLHQVSGNGNNTIRAEPGKMKPPSIENRGQFTPFFQPDPIWSNSSAATVPQHYPAWSAEDDGSAPT